MVIVLILFLFDELTYLQEFDLYLYEMCSELLSIHLDLQNKKTSGWSLKDGFRKSGPLGLHDGTYNEDYYYLGDDTELDECNGGIYNGKYVYFITDNYPRVPRCLYGEVSGDFNKNRH